LVKVKEAKEKVSEIYNQTESGNMAAEPKVAFRGKE